MRLTRDDDVWLLDLGDGANTFNADTLAELNAALDEVSAGLPAALVTTASGKSWCQGLDLAWMTEHGPAAADQMVADVHRLYLRFLHLGCFTVAAINGHAFGAGAMLAAAHDTSLMSSTRGWWCLPEADLGLQFPPGMMALLADRIPQPTLTRAMLTARRWTGAEAAEAGIVTAAVDGAELQATARAEAAAQSGRSPDFLTATRALLWPRAMMALAEVDAHGMTWGQ